MRINTIPSETPQVVRYSHILPSKVIFQVIVQLTPQPQIRLLVIRRTAAFLPMQFPQDIIINIVGFLLRRFDR
jgi:hypothetical protein